MLTRLQARDFRCFESLSVSFSSGFNFFVGENGQGKTSILEAACVLLRLQSQRTAALAPIVRLSAKSFSVAGECAGHELQFRYSNLRRKIEIDHVEQRTSVDYLRIGRVVSFANSDIELARGGAEARRRYLDFLGAQTLPRYRAILRNYERALRARNALLKSSPLPTRALAAYDEPLVQNGTELLRMRAELVDALSPFAAAAYRAISGATETLAVRFDPGARDFAAELAASKPREIRLRQTIVGPHRDDLELMVEGKVATQFASEGQQRTIALALKIAQARALESHSGAATLLLIDDVFGELDPPRRNALFAQFPADAQKLVTATTMDWLQQKIDGPLFRVERGRLEQI